MRLTKFWFISVLSVSLTIISCQEIFIKPKDVAIANESYLQPTADIEQHISGYAAMTGVNEHPRLFFDGDEIADLQARAATTHQEIWQPIKKYVDTQLGTSPPTSSLPDGGLEAYRNPGNQLIPFAFACVITGAPDYCNLAKRHLLTYAGWKQWDEKNRRDLGHAHMLMGNALAYDWLYRVLTPTERQVVRESLANWAQKMYEASSAESYQSSWHNSWRISAMQNHYWINNSALGVAGLALLGEDKRAQIWIDQASKQMSRIQYLLNGVQDGSWHESIPYQNYGLTMSLPFMVNLRRIQGVDILPHAYLRNYPYWRLYNLLPGSPEFNLPYGNFEWQWSNRYGPQGLLRFTANEYGNGYAEWTAQQITDAVGRQANVLETPWYVFEFLYYEPAISAHPPTDLPKARVFYDLEGVIWRTGWGDDDLIFGLKTGAYGGRFGFETFTKQLYPWSCSDVGCKLNIGHEHNDANGFYIRRAGRWLAPETIGYDRYETALHNTLLIDGQGQYRPQGISWRNPKVFRGSDGFLETAANTLNFDYVAANATQRYKNIAGMKDITRYVVFVRPDYFIMVDNLVANAAHHYEWISHFGKSVSIEGNWVRGNAGSGQILGVGIAAPQPFEITAGDDGRPYIHISPVSPLNDVRFINLLYPTDETSWDSRPDVTNLDDTGEAVVVRVQINDGPGRTDDILLTYAHAISAIAVGPYHYNGRVAVVSRGVDGRLQRLFMYGGSALIDQNTGTTLVTDLDEREPFEAIYIGHTVAVQSNIRRKVTLYAPQTEQLTVNGTFWPFAKSGDYITFKPRLPDLSWKAKEGSINQPFMVEDEYIYQTVETGNPSQGGRASYKFSIVEPGDYVVRAVVDASSVGSDSFFVNIDGEPESPNMIWDIKLTKGFEERTVSWRGSDTYPKIFTLAAGEHELIIRGREKHTRLQQIDVVSFEQSTMLTSTALNNK